MSSCDSDDLGGFESAEEELAVSDFDEKELQEILDEDSTPAEETKLNKYRPGQEDVVSNSQIKSVEKSAEERTSKVSGTSLIPDEDLSSTLLNKDTCKNVNNTTKPLHDIEDGVKHNSATNLPLDSKDLSQSSSQFVPSNTEKENFHTELKALLEKTVPPSSTLISEKDQEQNDLTSMTILAAKDTDAEVGWDFDEDFDGADICEKKLDQITEERPSQNVESNPAWSSWSNWGVSNLISTATEGVSTLTTMTSGLTSMLETTLGAPDPQVLASQLSSECNIEEKDIPSQSSAHDLFGLSNIIGGVKNLGNKVIDGGLETLESLGKKTMEVLQDGDPGLKKKRAFLFQSDKVVLSQVLKDAKEKAEAEEKEKQHLEIHKRAHYETLFDDFHGLVHLEALEMISRQCEIKLKTLSNNPKCSIEEFNESMDMVKQLYEQEELSDEDENYFKNVAFEEVLKSAIDTLSLNINLKNILEVHTSIESEMNKVFSSAMEIHTCAISDLAHFTACSIELFHRIAELLVVKEHCQVQSEFNALTRIVSCTKCKTGILSESYSAKLMLLPDVNNSPLITNIFLEASNSSTYLDNAYELFIPIFQLKLLKQNDLSLK